MSSDYFIEHVPQTQQMSCWAASTAMMLGYRDGQSYPESAVLEQFRDFGVDGADENECQQLAFRLGFNVVTNACRTALGWAELLDHGPVMVGMTAARALARATCRTVGRPNTAPKASRIV